MINLDNNIKIESSLSELDDSQLIAATSDADNILITASAGSGKTKSMIAAIVYYRNENPLDRICAITYTRAARAEMESRLIAEGVRDVEVTTIHVWSRNLLNELAKKYDFKVKILEEKDIKSILSDLIILTHSKVKPEILYNYVMGSKRMDVSPSYKRSLELLNRKYIAYKRLNGLYDFTDYPLYLLDKLKEYDEGIENVDALFVDEFQDVDKDQLQLFKRVKTSKKFFIGDSKQAIYIFRGADKDIFDEVLESKAFKKCKLGYNYRSYQEIIDFADTVYDTYEKRFARDEEGDYLISGVSRAYPSKTHCFRGEGGGVYTISPFGECRWINHGQQTARKVFDEIWEKQPMVLCRTNRQVKMIEEKGYYNVSTVHQAKGLEYDNVIVIDDPIGDIEDLNVAYVAITRARDNVLVCSFASFLRYMPEPNKRLFGG